MREETGSPGHESRRPKSRTRGDSERTEETQRGKLKHSRKFSKAGGSELPD